ncbi:MAG: hypothetical protein GXO42_01585 [bacterium]|nr:hypothetical protein [bacterium]
MLPEHYATIARDFVLVYDQKKAKLRSRLEKLYKEKKFLVPSIGKKVYEKFLEFVQTYSLFEQGEKICVAWSGGKDSTALLLLLEPVARLLELEVHAANVDVRPEGHGVWTTSAFQQVYNFYKEQLSSYSFVRLEVGEFRAKTQHCYLCSALRRQALTAYCKRHGIEKLVLAHTLDDAVETVFIMAYKGKRLKLPRPRKQLEEKEIEISGYKISWERIILVKPLLGIAEVDLLGLLKESGLPYYNDKLYCPFSSLHERTLRGKVDKLVKRMCAIDKDYLYNFIRSLNRSLRC